MKTSSLIIFLTFWVLASCTHDSDAEKTKSAPVRKTLSQRMDEKNGYKRDSEGNWKPQTDRRSSFESQGEASQFKKDFKKQEYKKGEYAKKSWWGNKEYDRPSYAGKTDGSRFQKTAAQQGQGAREANNNAKIPDRYDTDPYATNSAREAGVSSIGRPNNAEIENRRKVFDTPEIIDWRESRSLSVDQSKGILGR